MIILILNNSATLIDNVIEIVKTGANYFNTFYIAQDIFAIGFWAFSAWFTKKDVGPRTL